MRVLAMAALAALSLLRGTSLAENSAPAEDRTKSALFYSDLGPETVDVSAYPAAQRSNYAVYARTCSRCHTLARSINAPLVSRGWWEFYLLGMRMRSRSAGRPLTKEEQKAVLDFLEYDSRVRKVEHAKEFDALTKDLERRFDSVTAGRMRDLQEKNQRPLVPPGPDER